MITDFGGKKKAWEKSKDIFNKTNISIDNEKKLKKQEKILIKQEKIQQEQDKIQQQIQKEIQKQQLKEQEKQIILLEKQRHINLINSLKAMVITEFQERSWDIKLKTRNMPAGVEIPSPGNESEWTLIKEYKNSKLYESKNLNIVDCITPFGDSILHFIHYHYIYNIGGHITFEGHINNSKFNIRLGANPDVKKFGFWNVKHSLSNLGLEIKQNKFLDSQLAKCLIKAWIDFNGFKLPDHYYKNIIN